MQLSYKINLYFFIRLILLWIGRKFQKGKKLSWSEQ